jgi:hypothetical protein
MRFYRARLDRQYNCGNYKVMDYYLQMPTMTAAREHVRERHGRWRLLSLRLVPPPEEHIPAREEADAEAHNH